MADWGRAHDGSEVRQALNAVREAMAGKEAGALLSEFVRVVSNPMVRVVAMAELARAVDEKTSSFGVATRFPAAYLRAWLSQRSPTPNDIERAFLLAQRKALAYGD